VPYDPNDTLCAPFIEPFQDLGRLAIKRKRMQTPRSVEGVLSENCEFPEPRRYDTQLLTALPADTMVVNKAAVTIEGSTGMLRRCLNGQVDLVRTCRSAEIDLDSHGDDTTQQLRNAISAKAEKGINIDAH
jgi:hypothetical protein